MPLGIEPPTLRPRNAPFYFAGTVVFAVRAAAMQSSDPRGVSVIGATRAQRKTGEFGESGNPLMPGAGANRGLAVSLALRFIAQIFIRA